MIIPITFPNKPNEDIKENIRINIIIVNKHPQPEEQPSLAIFY